MEVVKLETWDRLLEAIAKGERCSGIAEDSRWAQLPVVGICEPDRTVRVLVNDRREDIPFDAPSWTWLSHGSLVNVPYMNNSGRGTGRTLRMCQVANVAAERGDLVAVIAMAGEFMRLRADPYRLTHAALFAPESQLQYLRNGRLPDGFSGYMLIDHRVWETMPMYRAEFVKLLARAAVDSIGAPYVPPDWPGMPKGDDWLVVADYWAENGDQQNEALARSHHSVIPKQ